MNAESRTGHKASRLRVYVGVAWPYANGPLHLGHVAGSLLPPDIFARYHRLRGADVAMVSGSDMHGTPITVAAEKAGVPAGELAQKYNASHRASLQALGIQFDLFTSTATANHRQTVHDVFLTLLKNGLIVKHTMTAPYDPKAERFLPDRYVEGTCPFCNFDGARGDQCDNCGRTLDPQDLKNPKSKLSGATPEYRETEHYFLRLPLLEERLKAWVGKEGAHWRANTLNFTNKWLNEGLKDRPITRDMTYGVPIPLPDTEGKVIYVWFEAVIGYLSATKELYPDRWKEFWLDPSTRSYYFLGKDNIPFHTIIWPAMLMGYAGGTGQPYNLPYDVPANEFMNFQGSKLSKSRGNLITVDEMLADYAPDAVRYYLSANMPETGDSDFSLTEFIRKNNDELVATYGNLVHRVLTFTYRNFDKKVPQPGALDDHDRALLAKVDAAMSEADGLLDRVKLKDALKATMALAQEANRYLDVKAPWHLIKTDRAATATALHTVLTAISGLKVLTYPYIPFSAQTLHQSMGGAGTVESGGWKLRVPVPGSALGEPKALFTKLDDAITAEETRKPGK